MNIVENEKLKFKEMTYVKSEYARLVNLSIFVCLPFNIYTLTELLCCWKEHAFQIWTWRRPCRWAVKMKLTTWRVTSQVVWSLLDKLWSYLQDKHFFPVMERWCFTCSCWMMLTICALLRKFQVRVRWERVIHVHGRKLFSMNFFWFFYIIF